ncbi:HPr family phosphocarrier protein [Dactylosporangium sp. AC04546]|uniref:HPr family phosphocarrier protein n=1 Tax=Dactylosporangium sp. AC04546 TaxID=2862460 RepID=UPI001EDE27C1|nr:HPr family phosphocarrier protein [Dactylosporangium sp. AC04546]WVK85354.1 HPr family phosphocarrier protein [Dactylosporangium sp. AC04546]
MSASCELPVVLPVDLHARPAAAVVRVVSGFSSTVEISHNGKNANAKSVLAVIGLGARAGSTVMVRGTGDDAEAAVKAVVSMLENTE